MLKDSSERLNLYEKAKRIFFERPINYFSLRLYYLIFMGFAGAILIYCFEQGNIAFIDTLFCSVSAITGTGLQTVSNLEFSRQSVAIIALLMFFGSIFIFLIPPMVARQYYNRKVLAEYKDRIDDIDPKIIEEHNNLNEALTASIRVSLVYMALWHILISLVIYGALFLHPQEPELVQRGYTRYQNSLFMTISAFANCGFTISSSAIFYWSNNPLAYFALSLPILAGNTCIPILFYFTYWSLIKIFDHFRWNSAPFRYILQNPSQISSHTLPWESTKFLLYGVLAINTTEYVFFLASSWYGQDVLGIYGSYAKIAGMGYFETISTRNAGIQIMDLTTLNKGMLVVYVIMMYISTFPFLGTVIASEIVRPKGSVSQRFILNVVGRHSFFIITAFLLITFIEDHLVLSFPANANIWYILFEVVSAYGNVGLSLSFPTQSFSLSGDFQKTSKMFIIFIMLLGKSRMLPHMRDPYIDTHYSDFRERADASTEMSKEYKEKQKNKPENDLTSLRRSMSLPLHFLHSPDLKKKKSMLDGSTDAPPESDYDSTSDLLPQSERLSPTKVSHKRSADAFLKV